MANREYCKDCGHPRVVHKGHVGNALDTTDTGDTVCFASTAHGQSEGSCRCAGFADADSTDNDLTLDSPIRDLFKRWKMEAGYIAMTMDGATATPQDGRVIQIRNSVGVGDIWLNPDWRADRGSV